VYEVTLPDGAVRAIAENLALAPASLAVDATHVYLPEPIATRETTIVRIPRAGGEAVRVSVQRDADSLAVDDGYVYFSQYQSTTAPFDPGGIFRVAVTGGDIEEFSLNELGATSLRFDADHVYWCNDVHPQNGPGQIRRRLK
ncbi:MAG: hypothetical protein M3619_25315, partial [Myxococcota bacterium]|nr:hypothetical protein [Myxococcota bacterium]